MRSLLSVAGLVLLQGVLASALAQSGGNLACCAAENEKLVCSAYAPDGTLAKVEGNSSDLEIRLGRNGHESTFSTKVEAYRQAFCEGHFSADSRLLVVVRSGARYGKKPSDWIPFTDVHFFDTASEKWIAHFTPKPPSGMAYVDRIVGFWNGEHKILAVGRERQANLVDTRLTFAVFGPDGTVLSQPSYAPERDVWVDAEHNRGWRARGKTCKVTDFPLIDDSMFVPTSADFDSVIDGPCEAPIRSIDAAFLGTEAILGARVYGERSKLLVKITPGNQTGATIPISSPRPGLFDIGMVVTGSSLVPSSDGRVAVLVVQFEALSVFNTFRKPERRVYLAALQPLRLVQEIKSKACSRPEALIVDHRAHKTYITGRWCGTWKTITIPDQ